jgi:hypothetical protein
MGTYLLMCHLPPGPLQTAPPKRVIPWRGLAELRCRGREAPVSVCTERLGGGRIVALRRDRARRYDARREAEVHNYT